MSVKSAPVVSEQPVRWLTIIRNGSQRTLWISRQFQGVRWSPARGPVLTDNGRDFAIVLLGLTLFFIGAAACGLLG